MDSTGMGSPPADDEVLSQARQGYADFPVAHARFQMAYKEIRGAPAKSAA